VAERGNGEPPFSVFDFKTSLHGCRTSQWRPFYVQKLLTASHKLDRSPCIAARPGDPTSMDVYGPGVSHELQLVPGAGR
jgi:hypothetical protein